MRRLVAVTLIVFVLTGCGGGSSGSGPVAEGGPPPAPIMTISPSSLSIGNEIVGTTSAGQSVSISNTGNTNLAIISVALAGADASSFSLTNNCGSSVAPAKSCTAIIAFVPTSSGVKAASVSIMTNAATNPSVSLSGTGLPSVVGIDPIPTVSPLNLTFQTQNIGTTSVGQTITISNTGTAPLNINSYTLTGPDAAQFSQSNSCGLPIVSGGSCTASITFTPTSAGSKAATYTLQTNSVTNPSVSLTGTGAIPVVSTFDSAVFDSNTFEHEPTSGNYDTTLYAT